MRFAFIQVHATRWPISVMCDVLDVTRSGYYAWKTRPASDRKKKQMELTKKIRLAHDASRKTYGSPRVHAQLMSQGESACLNTIAKRMKEAGIRVKPRKAFVPRTTVSDSSHQTYSNELDRAFDSALPNQKWVSDITYVPTLQGWLYLAVVIDLCSRKVVGYAMSDHLRSELASDALAMAIQSRRPDQGLLHHSDRGVQYTSEDYQRLLGECGMRSSMSGVGQCWDNAVAESFFGTLKQEHVNDKCYATRSQARSSVFEWIECWYNRRRLHSSLGYQSPETFEARFN
jgi:putative transposase